jgi:fructose-1,6-bisphosphatase/inositol monophosphatase family enzyme
MSYLGSNIKLWDYAAALAILKKLGMKATFFDRTEMSEEIRLNHKLKPDSSLNLAVKDKVIIGANEDIINYILKAAT